MVELVWFGLFVLIWSDRNRILAVFAMFCFLCFTFGKGGEGRGG